MIWSYSRLHSFSDCPYKWFLTYLYRDENGMRLRRKSGFFAEFGNYMHLLLQMYFDGVLRKEDLPMFYLSHYKDNVRSAAPNQNVSHNYFTQGFRYLDSFSFPNRRIIGVEESFDFTFAGKKWVGFIDLQTEDNKLIITDHKSRTLKPRSNRKTPTKSDLELDEYLKQLYIYSAAIHEKYGHFPGALEFNIFRTQTIIQEPFDIQKYHQVETWAKNEIETIIRNDDWSAKPEYWRCNYLCDVCQDCEYRLRG